jgi:hypothetical protein
MMSPTARRPSDEKMSNRGILLRLVNWIVFPVIGGSIRGKYSEMVVPINRITIVCTARSYNAKRYVSRSCPYEIPNKIEIKMPSKSRKNEIFTCSTVRLYLIFFSPLISRMISELSNPPNA